MEEMMLEAQARSHVYGLLARITRAEIDAEFLVEMRKPEVLEGLYASGVSLKCFRRADDEAFLEELATAYTYLFLLTINPHESIQRGEGRLWGNHTVAARDFLAEIGLEPIHEKSLLPDHVSVELEVMQHLTAEEAAREAAGDETGAARYRSLQHRFFREHAGAWIPDFFTSAWERSNHEFYGQLCDLGFRFLTAEGQDLLHPTCG
ncbi:MAG TPA: molecular chaperone TorD family protein [Symbiobacteriaceae bacterium]|nr:molecular chaperone TorD family protein [Symbiobacteriaceae bacterium]